MLALPQHPYQAADVAAAKASRLLPPQRNAAGLPIAGPPPPPPPPPPPLPIVHPPPRPTNCYPFDFWPARPWAIEPTDDPTLRNHATGLPVTGKDIGNDENTEHQDAWIDTKPYMWPVSDENEWDGSRFLGAGTYGSAGLWCRRDAVDNILEVSYTVSGVMCGC